MTTNMASPKHENIPPIAQFLVVINRLILKAYTAKSREALNFIVLNDTIQAIRYDRAALWNLENPAKPKLMGVSGQAKTSANTALAQKWMTLVQHIQDPAKSQTLTKEQFVGSEDIWTEIEEGHTRSSVLWLPILIDEKPAMGLWIERWHKAGVDQVSQEVIELLNKFLIPGFAAGYQRFDKAFSLKKMGIGRKEFYLASLIVLWILFFVRVPLRVVAPCEIVPENPLVITAPLEGIIAQVDVEPGQIVKKSEVLAEYDDRLPQRNLNVAQKEVDIAQAELDRASTLGLSDNNSLTQLSILQLKLEKQKVNLDLAEYYVTQLKIKSPNDGIVMLDNPSEWRGKPVQIGEKIMTVSNPNETKVRMWLPESDNIVLNPNAPVKIFLNINPEKSRPAKLIYIANESSMNEQQLPSFVAEAEWEQKQQPDIKLGLKGTAILYGQQVPLFYYIVRKPWGAFRHMIGL